MIIKSIELKNYKRLMLNNIKFIKLTPVNKVQLILGSNGSGKSSLLKELSPLPALYKEYKEKGFKRVFIEHNSSEYELISDFSSKSPRYSFIKNGEELNISGTITVYKDLVKQEFNITQDVHDLMIGKTSFHNMTIAERRSWFTKISDVDYTYAIRYFNKLKERMRDISGGIKLAKSRLINESDKILTETEIEKLKSESKTLNEIIDKLLDSKTVVNNDLGSIVSSLKNTENSIEALSKDIFNISTTYSNSFILGDRDDLRLSIVSLMTECEILNKELKNLYSKIESSTDTLKIIENNNINSKSELIEEHDKVKNKLESLLKQKKFNWTNDNPVSTIESLDAVRQPLIELVKNLKEVENREERKSSLKQMMVDKSTLEETSLKIDRRLEYIIRRLEELDHLKTHNSLECPECKHKWIKGYSEKEKNKLLIEKETMLLKSQSVKNKLNELTKTLEYEMEYNNTLRSLKQLMDNWKSLFKLWDYIIENDYIYNNPDYIPILVDEVYEDYLLQVNIETLNKKLVELDNDIKTLDLSKEIDKKALEDDIDNLNKNIHNILNKINSNKDKITKYELYLKTVDELSRLNTELSKLIATNETLTNEYINALKQKSINDCIRNLKVRLSEIENKLSTVYNQKAIVQSIEKDLKEMEKLLIVYKVAVKNLSPTEGLIAKGLQGFINNFVRQINNFISQVWLYPLELIPITAEEDKGLDLDFKFNVRINEHIVINDINEGSSAMKEIIDLAFKIVSMQYLGLDKAPLFLDEFGVKMDHSHRESAHYAITNLVNTSNFSQIYMVSHYESSYGSFKNADITVLNASNIILPRDTAFNTVAVIE